MSLSNSYAYLTLVVLSLLSLIVGVSLMGSGNWAAGTTLVLVGGPALAIALAVAALNNTLMAMVGARKDVEAATSDRN
jgi:hypothetical protein